MAHYFLKLVPPRPGFAHDMTEDEQNIMERHAAYWQGKLDEGAAIVFGPVFDPSGPYGLGIANLPDEAAAGAFAANDPAIEADRGFRYEIFPIAAVTRESR